MSLKDAIIAKRDGLANTEDHLRAVAVEAARADASWGQLGAWLMAAFLNGLSDEEAALLTQAMAESGETIDREGLPRPWLDKHSTGGVGDKTTIVLLPLLASCGLTLVKMSGPGLGQTGGTVDKLASIPGFRLDLSPEEMKLQASRIGLALSGQTPRLAPADKSLYALRDVTGTVANIALITASILSKKMASGADSVVFDVKCGSGAFMPDLAAAQGLAASLRRVGKAAGMDIRSLITEMNRPLGRAIGNALEVREAWETLAGEGPGDLRELCLALAAEALAIAGLPAALAEEKLASGEALAKAEEWIAAQGGDMAGLATVTAPHQTVVRAERSGYISEVSALQAGLFAMRLGAGRERPGEPIDPRVGIVLAAPIGAPVKPGDPLAVIHSAAPGDWTADDIGVRLADAPPAPAPVVLARVNT
jgi:pyrimidine-nucleoside phosphorylase